MALLALEHSRAVYWADFAFYGAVVCGLAAALAFAAPNGEGWSLALMAAAGLGGWTLIEYLLHRFVLHGLQPFSRWHAEHHQRPSALIASPTVFSASLLLVLVVWPAWWLFGMWPGLAVTCGVLAGYLAYTVTHHATHHWNFDNAWLKRRKRAHALHHHFDKPVGFGVTSEFWDRVFGSTPRAAGR
jgi:cyclopropane-fatty-acyl-phospholipid synthase